MKRKLLNNLGLKLLSIFLAFFVWLFVIKVSNPWIPGRQEVPIQVLNESVLKAVNKTYEIVGKDSVAVNYEVSTQDASLIRASDFKATIDLSDYNVTGAVPVKIEVNPEKVNLIRDMTPNPMVIKVHTEELQRKPFDLVVKTKGKQEDGYELGSAQAFPSTIYVSGPVSQVGKITQVGIEVDVDGASADLTGKTEPVFYDANGNKVPAGDKVTLSRQEINYKVTVLKVKYLNLDFDVQGQVANGYRYTGVECDTKTIPVVGMKSVLASLSSITIPAQKLDITGATADKVVTVDVKDFLPPSATIAGDVSGIIKVTLKVEPLRTQDFTISMDDIPKTGESGDYLYAFDKDQVVVTVKGLQEDLDKLSAQDLHPSMDLSHMSPGTYKGSLTFNVGEGFEVSSYTDFNITVTSKNEESSSSEGSAEGSAEGPNGQVATQSSAAP